LRKINIFVPAKKKANIIMSRTYKIYYAQGDRRSASITGTCQRKDGKVYSLLRDGTIAPGRLDEHQKSQIWEYVLTSFGEIPEFTDGKKRSYSYIHVPEQEDIDRMTTKEDRNHAAKMQNLINYIKLYPQVEHKEFDRKTGAERQLNPNFDGKNSINISFILKDETAIEEEDFRNNRIKVDALGMLNRVYDRCVESKNWTELTDLCYGLNTSITPYMNEPKINFNRIEDFINNQPGKFITFMEKEEERRLIILFRKAVFGVSKDIDPLIRAEGETYFFNDQIIGQGQEEVLYYLKTNKKIADYMADSLNVKRDPKELAKAEQKLTSAIIEAEVIKAEEPDPMDVVVDLRLHAEKWINFYKKAFTEPDSTKRGKKIKQLTADLKAEMEDYQEDNRIAFIDIFNPLATTADLPATIQL
jgi:hypothetical protein